ncbi:MAG: hypothetical protein EYC70_01630 [Planctomycetota bacterium]|nr:MAG: hypothetical protein EYC70_01630 [Planctomycetota bacterium]
MKRRRWRWLLLLPALYAVALPFLNACAGPLRVEPLRQVTRPPVVDRHLELARAYAPWILHESHPTKGRQDLPAPVDFDGDLYGRNNWDNFPYFELVPTVYYAVLETPTHWFLSYHLFQPRDWAGLDLGLHQTHENDGENLQVVVSRGSGAVVLLFTQAHFRGRVYAGPAGGIAGAAVRIRGDVLLVDGGGRPSAQGRHPVVFVESGGHGIFGLRDSDARAALAPAGGVEFARHGYVLRPAQDGEGVREPRLLAGVIPYRLESTTARLWPLLRSGELAGDGCLLDRAVPYRDARVAIGVPRYYESDRFSGPLGPDRGISPFALDFGFRAPDLGSLFFDPARRYAECLEVSEPWSLEYVDYPFSTRDG